jgi:hypothetical protein
LLTRAAGHEARCGAYRNITPGLGLTPSLTAVLVIVGLRGDVGVELFVVVAVRPRVFEGFEAGEALWSAGALEAVSAAVHLVAEDGGLGLKGGHLLRDLEESFVRFVIAGDLGRDPPVVETFCGGQELRVVGSGGAEHAHEPSRGGRGGVLWAVTGGRVDVVRVDVRVVLDSGRAQDLGGADGIPFDEGGQDGDLAVDGDVEVWREAVILLEVFGGSVSVEAGVEGGDGVLHGGELGLVGSLFEVGFFLQFVDHLVVHLGLDLRRSLSFVDGREEAADETEEEVGGEGPLVVPENDLDGARGDGSRGEVTRGDLESGGVLLLGRYGSREWEWGSAC